jgi:hypothetical protein
VANSHKRETVARRKPKFTLVAAPLAVLATGAAVTLGVLASSPAPEMVTASDASTSVASAGAAHHRDDVVSRGESRMDAARIERAMRINDSRVETRMAVQHAHTRRWTTTALNLWTAPDKDAHNIGLVEERTHLLVTGRHAAGRDEVVVDGHSRWVTSGYLAEEKPVTEAAVPSGAPAGADSGAAASAPAGLSSAPCPDSSVESGLTSSAVLVYRSVCHAFPQITTYGGWDAHGEHSSGKALDVMTSDVTLGTSIAEFLQSHASELHLYDIIWRQHIWTPERSSEGWRYMPSRGSTTANHYDHVHVSTY